MSDSLDTNNKDAYFSTKEAAEMLGIRRDDVSTLIRSNKLPNAYRVNNRWQVSLKDIKEYQKNIKARDIENCFNVKEVTLRLGYKNEISAINLIEKSILPNAFKYKGKWWIPKTDIEYIEKKQRESLDTSQACQRLNLGSAHYVSILINKKIFPNAFKDHNGRWRIPLSDINEYVKKSGVGKTISILEAAERLGYGSKKSINSLLRRNQLPGAYKFQGSWRIPLSDLEEYMSHTDGCLDLKQIAERLGYKNSFSINQLIERSIFPNAFKFNEKWWIPESDILAIEKRKSDFLNTKQIGEKLGVKRSVVSEMIRKKKFPNAYKGSLGEWLVPLKDLKDFQEKNTEDENHDMFITVGQATELLEFKSKASVLEFLHDKNFPNAYKHKGRWRIPLKDIARFHLNFDEIKKEKVEKRMIAKDNLKTKDCLDDIELGKILNLENRGVSSLIKDRAFPNAFLYKRKWWIPKEDIKEYQRKKEEEKLSEKTYLSTAEVAKRLNYKNRISINNMIIKNGEFPNAFKVGQNWCIPLADVEELEERFRKSRRKVNYLPEMGYKELKEFIDAIYISKNLRETKSLYLQFCLLQINNMGGSNNYKQGRVRLYISLYEKLIESIREEVFLVPSDDISNLLDVDSELRQYEKKALIVFLRYAYHQKNIEPDQEFSFTTTPPKTETQEIYSPEEFHEIYQHVKETFLHVPLAVKDRSYANMWVYTILLLTDFIRGQDLIVNTPNIDLEVVEIDSLVWISNNDLSESKAQSIINQLYTHFRYKRASKTDELLTFIVAPDLVVSLATALIISEFHRRFEKSPVQLETFLEGKFNKVRTSGKRKHKKFFLEMKNSSTFKFSSLKMNRSVATYLFYSITEEEGQDSDLALHLTQVSRSHKSSDSTSTYVQATNKDGSINRVSYNLFKRGHFGWLYNYLILYASQFQSAQDTLEQRSELIEQVRQDISPLDLESAAKFVNNSLSPMPLNRNSDSMEVFLQSVYKKRQSVISKLHDYSKEEIREILTKLANGNLPSKNEHAQCLVAPKCKNPKLTNCFSCEYVIPGNLMLIQLNEELNRLIRNIESETNEVILQRESRFLMHTLFIWKEARMEYGDEKVNAYISAEEKWKEIESVAHKIIID